MNGCETGVVYVVYSRFFSYSLLFRLSFVFFLLQEGLIDEKSDEERFHAH